ncbi:MAG: ADP-ribosylation factor-like protein [Candidatus Hodarchaeota archaeon]
MELKILLCGLEDAGKTSILLVLDKKFSLLTSVAPTIKAKRTSHTNKLLGISTTRWDLGGQKAYRKIYLDNKSKYFTEMQSIFYIIDIQNKDKFDEALIYLKDITNIITDNHPDNFQLLILFHKYDPDIKNKEEMKDNIHFLENKINSIIKKLKYSFYRTSIYDDSSLIKAFSDGVFSATEKSKLLQSLLRDYMSKTYTSSTLLLDQNCFIIASRATNEAYQEICEAIAPRLTNALEKLEEWDIDTNDIITNIEFPQNSVEQSREGIIFLRKLEINNDRLYLIALCLNKRIQNKSYEYLPILASNLKNLLESFE